MTGPWEMQQYFQTLRWCHNGRDSVSNHQPHDCLLNHLFRRRSKKTTRLRVTGLCVGNSPETGEFPAQMAIWWRHYDMYLSNTCNEWHLQQFMLNYPQLIASGPRWWCVNIVSGNSLVRSGNKPLPEPMLTQIISPHGVTRPQWVNVKNVKNLSALHCQHHVCWWFEDARNHGISRHCTEPARINPLRAIFS